MNDEKEQCEIQTKGAIELIIQRLFELMKTDRSFKIFVIILGFLFVILINADKVVKIAEVFLEKPTLCK